MASKAAVWLASSSSASALSALTVSFN
jgi:hypothetical protein